MAPPALADMHCTADFERAARDCVPAVTWDYLSGGEADTIAVNDAAFGQFRFRPRVLVDVSDPDVGCAYLGARRSTPFYLSSVAKGGLVAGNRGEAAFVRAAAKTGSAFIVPSLSSLPYDKIWASTSPGQKLPFQFYLLSDQEQSWESLKLALKCGASAVVVTVDANAPRAGQFRSNTTALTGMLPSPVLNWERLRQVRDAIPADMPLYLKGIQTAEDALQAVRFGVQGVIVSNHGGRCCEDAWSSLSALEDVSTALRAAGLLSGVDLLFDSGVRSGRDALKALCLGARGIGLGRPYYWASACHGEEGVEALLNLLTAELRHAMAQIGATRLSDLEPSCLCRVGSVPRSLSPAPETEGREQAEANRARARL